jgi:membrane protein
MGSRKLRKRNIRSFMFAIASGEPIFRGLAVRRIVMSSGWKESAGTTANVRCEQIKDSAKKTVRRRRLRRHWRELRALTSIVGRELMRTRIFDSAAGLAFWSMLSMVPLLMTVVAFLSLLHLPGLTTELLAVMAMLVPPSSLEMMERMVGALLTPHRGALSFGVVSYIWSSTGGFTALIAALDVAYDVRRERSWLRDRLQAMILTFTSGGLLTLSLLGLLIGPQFTHFIAQIVLVPPRLERLWPTIRITTVFVCFVMGLELVYFLGPNVRQRFRSTLPGAVFAIAVWFAGSAGLSFYLDHFSGYSKLYGGMGAVIGLMLWTYLMALALLTGAEINAELAKRRDVILRADQNAICRARSREAPTAA